MDIETINTILELNKPEIIYELRIRGQNILNNQTADELRNQLTELLSSPNCPQSTTISPNDLNSDINDINKCLKILETCINTYPVRKNKIPAYITHIRNRLGLINYDDEISNENILIINSLSGELSQLNTRYENLTPTPQSTYHSAESVIQSNPIIPTTYFDALTNKIVSLHDYKIHNDLKKFNFKGDSCPRHFINKIEEYASIRKISKSTLYSHIYDLLSGNALDWFSSKKNIIEDWQSFSTQLINDYEITNHDYLLKKQIDKRKQNQSERIITYISHMESLFIKLHEPITEKEKINILIRNLRPEYSLRLTQNDLISLNSLIDSCKFTEKLLQINNQSTYLNDSQPTTSKQTYLQPNLNQQRTNNNLPYIPKYPYNNAAYAVKFETTSTNKLPTKLITPSYPTFTCPRCRTNSHPLTTCTNEQIVCYRCGLKNVKFPNCPNCHKSNSKN